MRLSSGIDAGTTYRSITLTIIVTFAVSFAFLYWRRESREAPVLATPSLPSRQVERPPLPPRLPAPSVASVEAAVSSPAAAHPKSERKSDAPPPVPVLFKVTRETPDPDQQDSTDVTAALGEVHLVNSSDKDLAVTVVVTNMATLETSQADVFLAPNAEGRAGPDQGLKLHSGDQITLRSPGFTDLQFTAP
jgi:hypothetical protein